MMKKYLLIILLAFWCLGAGRMWDYGALDLWDIGNLTWVDQIDSGSSFPTPDARYRFESGALLTDSSGNGHTLTEDGTLSPNTSTYWEGSASVTIGTDEGAYVAVWAGAWLTSGNETGSVTFWVNPTNLNISRWILSDSGDGLEVWFDTSGNLKAKLYYSTGSSETVTFGGDTISADEVWHVCIRYNDTSGNWVWRIWDESASTQHSNETDNFVSAHGNLDNISGNLHIWQYNNGAGSLIGEGDHMVFFPGTELSDAQCDAIRNNTAF